MVKNREDIEEGFYEKLSREARERYWKSPKKHRAYAKQYRERHLEKQRERERNEKRKMRELLLEKIGSKCILCGSEKKMFFHEINGKPHSRCVYYNLKHIENFVPLCYSCHQAIHLLARIGVDLDKTVILINKLRDGKAELERRKVKDKAEKTRVKRRK